MVKPDSYSVEYLGYKEKTSELEAIFSEVEKWEKENDKIWWLEFWN